MRKRRFSVTTEDGITISGTEYGEEDAPRTIFFLHGFSSTQHNSTNTRLVPLAVSLGMRAVSFDFRGCGASGGELRHTTITTGIRDFTSVATHVAREGDAIGPGFVASSFGAAVALAVASDYNARRLLLKAPMINIAGAQLQRRGAEEMERWKRSGSIVIDDEPDKILDYDYVADAARYDLYDSQLVDPMLSIDIVQGTLDEVAPISFTRKFVELSDARTLFAIEGADHHFSTPAHFDEMIERLSDGIRTLSRD